MIYSNKETVIIKGSLPPPVGGVSVYLDRLTKQLELNSISYYVWDISQNRRRYYLNLIKIITNKWPENTIFHLHSVWNKHLFVVILLSYFKPFKIYFTNHNIWALNKKYKTKIFLLRWLLKRIDKLFYVNPKTLDKYRNLNIKVNVKSFKISPFLPPDENQYSEIYNSYPPSLKSFIKEHSPVLVANAHKIVFDKNKDLYGLDICIELLNKLRIQFPGLGLVFAIGDTNFNKDYVSQKINQIKLLGIKENFYLLTPQYIIWPLIKDCDLFLRPTTTDGLSVSIDEALYFKTNVLASDVTIRQPGTITFKNRDVEDFADKALAILNKQHE